MGEVLTSPTGNEFAYSQSPSSMKAVSASMWLLTVSAGNFILMIVAETKFFERAGEVSQWCRVGVMTNDSALWARNSHLPAVVLFRSPHVRRDDAFPVDGQGLQVHFQRR